MKTKGLLRIVVLFFCVIGFPGVMTMNLNFHLLRFNKHFLI